MGLIDDCVLHVASLPRVEVARLRRARTSHATLKMVCRWRLSYVDRDQWEEVLHMVRSRVLRECAARERAAGREPE